MDVTAVASEILDYVGDALADASFDERLMVLLYVGEHCKAQAETVLAHEYHKAIYGMGDTSKSRERSELTPGAKAIYDRMMAGLGKVDE